MQKDFAGGSQAIERAHTQAQAQAQDRIIEDQALVIANLWRVLAWAGLPPQQVSIVWLVWGMVLRFQRLQDRLIEDQAHVIANLWRVLARAGLTPQQVRISVIRQSQQD